LNWIKHSNSGNASFKSSIQELKIIAANRYDGVPICYDGVPINIYIHAICYDIAANHYDAFAANNYD